MAKIIIDKKTFSPIIDTQRTAFFESLNLIEKNGTYEIYYEDKNYLCKPYWLFCNLVEKDVFYHEFIL